MKETWSRREWFVALARALVGAWLGGWMVKAAPAQIPVKTPVKPSPLPARQSITCDAGGSTSTTVYDSEGRMLYSTYLGGASFSDDSRKTPGPEKPKG